MVSVDGTITNPDDALDTLLALAAWLDGADTAGVPYAFSRGASRLAGLAQWLDAHARAGGALPTAWAAAPDGADDTRPVTDVPLPRSGLRADAHAALDSALAITRTADRPRLAAEVAALSAEQLRALSSAAYSLTAACDAELAGRGAR